ncbi:MAG TPA: DNA mismatch repair protein MutS [Thermoplasmata archaeon]|nr:DNA mismatch repair protein MutS [Thermoplasmata archaeon]
MPSEGASSTPLLEQYEGVKAQYPGHLVLFRVGDFYETFGDDAKLLARELEVVLTARAPDASGSRMPMAGVPHHAVESYLGRLVRKGYKVAVCDQVEDARFAKGLVRREVTRVVTPGTVVEERILPGADHNFLAAVVVPRSGPPAYSAVDITTGEWFHGVGSGPGAESAAAALAAFAPREVLYASDGADSIAVLSRTLRREFPVARLEPAPLPLAPSELPERISTAAGVAETTRESDARLAAYVRSTQPRLLPFLEVVEGPGARRLALDGKTLRHLEVTQSMNPDDPKGATLLSVWDESTTAPGHRTIAFWLRQPLADVPSIRGRLDAVEHLVGRGIGLRHGVERLRPFADVARIAARVAGRRVRPPELGALRESLSAANDLRAWLGGDELPDLLDQLRRRLAPLTELEALLGRALVPELPSAVDDGNLFRTGFDPTVDALEKEERDGLGALESLERREQETTGIRTLRVRYNQVFGYYFEVSRPNLPRVPAHFRRKQTVAQGERFTSEELAELERRILEARERRDHALGERWEELLAQIDRHVPAIHRLARAVGELDALVAFARLAQERGLARPEVDTSRSLTVRDGRHPVLDRLLAGRFVPNDTELDADGARVLVLTGPNMAGKSTYMRQLGLIVLLAQCGSFVPARFARVGVVSRLYTRMGFTDEIGRGKSSFMVEMSEVAEILRGSDAGSLVLLDEVGRGTSTFDGLALAWATLRYLHDRIGCRTVLATHYHQLTQLVESLPGARNAHLAVRESGDEIVFLHQVVPGSTDRSLGLHVARLAGVPSDLVRDAEQLLKRLDAGELPVAGSVRARGRSARYTQAILLPTDAGGSEVERALRELDPDRLAPLDALRWVTEWRRRLEGPGPEEDA